MPKPSAVPTWNTDGSNRTTPTGGQIVTGIVAGEAANSSRMNYLLNLIGQWLSWIDAGVLTGVSFVASGVLTAGGLLTGLAGLSITGAAAISGAVTAASASISGNATVGGTLTSTGLITATAGVTAAANQHVSTSGTGRHKHGTLTMVIPALAGIGVSNDDASDPYTNISTGGATAGGGIRITADGTPWTIPITGIPVGDRITEVRGRVQDDSASPTTIAMALWRWDYSGANPSPLQLGSTQNSDGSDTIQTLTITTTKTIVAGENLTVHFAPSNNTGEYDVYYIEVDFDDL